MQLLIFPEFFTWAHVKNSKETVSKRTMHLQISWHLNWGGGRMVHIEGVYDYVGWLKW